MNTVYALIKDRDPSHQGLPLRQVVHALVRRLGVSDATPVNVTMASGYGKRVNELDDGTEAGRTVVAPLRELTDIIDDDDEWFHELRATLADGAAFGILDSSAVIVEGERIVVMDIIENFRCVSMHDGGLLVPG